MPMAQYSVIKKEQIIDMQKILGRLQDMQIEKNNSLKIIEIENDQFLPVYKHGKGCEGV